MQDKMCYLSLPPCQREHLVSLPWIQVRRRQQIQQQSWFHCWADTTGRCPWRSREKRFRTILTNIQTITCSIIVFKISTLIIEWLNRQTKMENSVKRLKTGLSLTCNNYCRFHYSFPKLSMFQKPGCRRRIFEIPPLPRPVLSQQHQQQ